MKWLAANRFIELTKRPGLTPSIQLLDPLWSGKPLPPWDQQADGRSPPQPLRDLPHRFWSHGWLLHLSPVAIAVMFALREHLGGKPNGARYMLRDRRDSYELSHDTWTRGTRELKEVGLLTVKRVPQGDEYIYTRLRNAYQLDISPLNSPVPQEPSGSTLADENPWADDGGYSDEPPF